MSNESRIVEMPRVEVSVSIKLNEAEMRALDALVGYGTDSFLQVFYEKLGKSYMQPHEAGLRSLFSAVSENIPAILRRADAARKAFGGHQ
jgi:hypothetical protein